MNTLHLICFSYLLQHERRWTVSLPLPCLLRTPGQVYCSHVEVCTADICTRSVKALSEWEIHGHYGKMHILSWDWSHMQLGHLLWDTRKDTAGLLPSLLCNPGNKERNGRDSDVLSQLCSFSGIIMTALAQLSSLLGQLHDKCYLLIITQNYKSHWSFHISWY